MPMTGVAAQPHRNGEYRTSASARFMLNEPDWWASHGRLTQR